MDEDKRRFWHEIIVYVGIGTLFLIAIVIFITMFGG